GIVEDGEGRGGGFAGGLEVGAVDRHLPADGVAGGVRVDEPGIRHPGSALYGRVVVCRHPDRRPRLLYRSDVHVYIVEPAARPLIGYAVLRAVAQPAQLPRAMMSSVASVSALSTGV